MDFKSFLEFQWNAICQVIAWNDKESWIKMNSFFVVYMMRVCLLGNLGLLFSHKKKRWSSHKPHLFFSFSAYLIPKAPTPSPEPIQPQLLARPRLRLTMNTAPAKPMSNSCPFLISSFIGLPAPENPTCREATTYFNRNILKMRLSMVEWKLTAYERRQKRTWKKIRIIPAERRILIFWGL